MVEGPKQQVNDDDVADGLVLNGLAMKINGQLELMQEMMNEDGFSFPEAIEALTIRFENFLTEFRYQSMFPPITGGIPQMPEVPEEGR